MRPRSHLVAFVLLLTLSALCAPLPRAGSAQAPSAKSYRPDRRRALAAHTHVGTAPTRPGAYSPKRIRTDKQTSARPLQSNADSRERKPARAERPARSVEKDKARAS